MKFTINSLSVNEFGKKENQSIIFIHGFPYDYTMWENQIRALQKNYYCVAYDVRGLGESYVGDGQYTMEAFVHDLYSIIDEMGLNKPVICGLSMGGYIALRAVEIDQSKFGGLILCDTRSEADNDEGKLKRAAAINMINVEGLDKYVDSSVPRTFSEEAVKRKKKAFVTTMDVAKRSNPTGVKGCLIAMMGRTDTTKFLKKIKLPTLVLSGSFDVLTPPVMMRDMAVKIKGSEFAIVPRAGHMSPIENPSMVNDMIKGFMGRLTGKK